MADSSGHYPIEIPPRPEGAVPEDSALMAAIDRASRWPVLFYFTAGIFWLFVGAAIGMLSYYKFRHPEHLATDPRTWIPFVAPGTFDFIPLSWVDLAPLTTFGRLKPAFHHVLIYGWACSAAIGLLLWVLARSCKTKLPLPTFLLALGHVWHFGVLVGLVRILCVGPMSREWLDMPPVSLGILLFSFLGTALVMFGLVFATLKERVYITTKYMIAAMIWFPAMLGIALIMFNTGGLKGVLSSIVNFWYMDALVGLWFTPVALGSIYFLVPKITGRPIANSAYANAGFWGLAILGGLTGLRHIYAFPVPEWLTTLSVSAALLMAIPTLLAFAAIMPTIQASRYLLSKNVAFRFLVFGLFAFLVQNTVGAVLSMGAIQKVAQFTIATDAKLYLMIYAFPSMVFFGAIYYVLPKILGVEWHSRRLVEVHYWVTMFSTIFLTVFMFSGGTAQGNVLQEADNYISTVVLQARLITFLGSLFWMAITVSNLLFLYNLLRSILAVYDPTAFMLGLVTAERAPDRPTAAETPTSNAQA